MYIVTWIVMRLIFLYQYTVRKVEMKMFKSIAVNSLMSIGLLFSTAINAGD